MKFALPFFILACFFISCSSSNGKIELRKSKKPCLMIPLEMQAEVDTAYSTTDTIALKRQIEKENYRNLKAQNLKSLLSKKKQYEDEAIEAYLINTSSSEIYTFTVKITLDDSLQTSKTEIYKANPGQEILIGCNSYMTEDMQIQKQTFKVVGEKKGN